MANKTGRSGRSPAFSLMDFLYIAFCFAGALLSLVLFWRDLNQTLTRLSEHPVGTISYKYRAAQRRFTDRLLWDRLKQESMVFSGDYIRTAQFSEATVSFFAGGKQISLEENTLIRILSGGTRIELERGELTADARGEGVSDGFDIGAWGAFVNVPRGSMVAATAAEDGLVVRVYEGSAEIQNGEDRRTASAGEVYGEALRGAGRVAVLLPRPQAKLLNNSEAPLPVAFTFNRIGFTGNENVRLDIAKDRGFERIVQSIENGTGRAAVDLSNGLYYWRAYPEAEAGAALRRGGVSGRLQVVYAPPPLLISPGPDEVFSFKTIRPGIRFQWSACEGAQSYLVEAAKDRDMGNIVFSSNVHAVGKESGSVVFSGFEPGNYFWQVRPLYPRDYEGQGVVSRSASFRIEQAAVLNAPQITERQDRIYLGGEKGNNYFTWKKEDDAVSYTFLISEEENLNNPIIERQVRDNFYVFDAQAEGISPGQYYWGVYQTDMEGTRSAFSRSNILVVLAGAPPARNVQVIPKESTTVTQESATIPEEPVTAPGASAGALPPAAPPERTIPPLPAPGNLNPGAGYVLTQEILMRDDRKVVFGWSAVAGASGYTFTLYQVEAGGNKEILRRDLRERSFTITDLSLLDEGEFIWRVTAAAVGRTGETAESRFTVQLEAVGASEGKESGTMFGKE